MNKDYLCSICKKNIRVALYLSLCYNCYEKYYNNDKWKKIKKDLKDKKTFINGWKNE